MNETTESPTEEQYTQSYTEHFNELMNQTKPELMKEYWRLQNGFQHIDINQIYDPKRNALVDMIRWKHEPEFENDKDSQFYRPN